MKNENYQGNINNVEHSYIKCDGHNHTHEDESIYNGMEACHREKNKETHSDNDKHMHSHEHTHEDGVTHTHSHEHNNEIGHTHSH